MSAIQPDIQTSTCTDAAVCNISRLGRITPILYNLAVVTDYRGAFDTLHSTNIAMEAPFLFVLI